MQFVGATMTGLKNPPLPEDGIIDEVAIIRAVSGSGPYPIRMTAREREVAAEAIIRAGGGVMDLAARLGLGNPQAAWLARSLGYHVGRGRYSGVSEIVTADCSRLAPRDGHGPASTCMCETWRA